MRLSWIAPSVPVLIRFYRCHQGHILTLVFHHHLYYLAIFLTKPYYAVLQCSQDSSNGSISPITFIPTRFSTFNTISTGRSSSVDDAIFICVTGNRINRGSRIGKMLKNIAHIGRIIVESGPGDMNHRVQQLILQYRVLVSLPIP